MGLETGNYISDLVITNPDGADSRVSADDHLRLIKKTVKGTFPNVNGPVNATPAQLNLLVGKTSVVDDAQLAATAFNAALPSQTGNAGKFVTTDGTNASWAFAGISDVNATITDNTTLTGSYKYVPVAMAAMGKSVTLPAATGLSKGGPQFIIKNDGGYPFGVRDNTGTLLTAVSAGGAAYVTLKDNATAAGSWSVIGDNLEPGLITIDNTFSSTYSSTVLAPFVALDSNTSIHFLQLSSGFAAVVVDNAGKAVGTPVTVTATAGLTVQQVFKVSSTSAICFYGSIGGTNSTAVVLTVTGTSPALGLSVGTAVTATTGEAWCDENFTGTPRIAQLSPTLYVASSCRVTTNLPVTAIVVTGSSITVGNSASVITSGAVAGSTTAYALTATTALVIYLSGGGPYTVNAVVVSVSGTTCTVGTPASAGTTVGQALPYSSCLLSSTKALLATDAGVTASTTTIGVHALTIAGTAVTWGSVGNVEASVSVSGVANPSYTSNSATRYNPHLFPLSASTALFWYMDTSSISRAVVLSESGGTVTAGQILYRSVSSGASDGRGCLFPQGANEFLVLKQELVASHVKARAVAHKVTGTIVTVGAAALVEELALGAQVTAQTLERLSSGDYAVTLSSSASGVNSEIPIFRSNGEFVVKRGSIKVPTLITTIGGGVPRNLGNNIILLGSTQSAGTAVATTTYQLRLLNVEIAA